MKDKELKKWSHGRRRKILKTRASRAVGGVVNEYVKLGLIPANKAGHFKSEMLSDAVNIIESEKFYSLVKEFE